MALEKKYYTKTLGKYVASGARSDKPDTVHIISNQRKRWAVVKDGSERSMRVFPQRQTAVTYARKYLLGKNKMADIIIHDENGDVIRAIEVKSTSSSK